MLGTCITCEPFWPFRCLAMSVRVKALYFCSPPFKKKKKQKKNRGLRFKGESFKWDKYVTFPMPGHVCQGAGVLISPKTSPLPGGDFWISLLCEGITLRSCERIVRSLKKSIVCHTHRILSKIKWIMLMDHRSLITFQRRRGICLELLRQTRQGIRSSTWKKWDYFPRDHAPRPDPGHRRHVEPRNQLHTDTFFTKIRSHPGSPTSIH